MIEVKMCLNRFARRCGYFFNAASLRAMRTSRMSTMATTAAILTAAMRTKGSAAAGRIPARWPILPGTTTMVMTRWSSRSPMRTLTPGI